MESKIARLEEGHRDLEEAIVDVRDYVSDVKKTVYKEVEKLENKIGAVETNIREVEVTVSEVVRSIAIIQNDSQYTREAITEIKKDIHEIRKAREDDHFIKPLSKQDARNEKMWWAIVGSIITALVTGAAAALIAIF